MAKVVKEEKLIDYLFYIMHKVVKRADCNKKASKKNRLKRQSSLQISPVERPDQEEIVEKSLLLKRIKL